MAGRLKSYGASAVLALGLIGWAQAGVITSITTSLLSGSSTGTIGPIGATPAPNIRQHCGGEPEYGSIQHLLQHARANASRVRDERFWQHH